MFDRHIEVKNLPQALRSALESVKYRCADIPVEAGEKVSPSVAGCKGRRGFFMLVDLATGKRDTTWGSWGGANMFNPGNRVDLDTKEYPLRPGLAAVKGEVGGGGKSGCRFAWIHVHPENLTPLLPAQDDGLTARQMKIVNIYCGIRGGYRDEYLRDGRVEKWELEQLEDLGYLKINRAGAVSVTTKAKNARTERSSSSCLWRWSDEEMRKPEKVERAERSFAVEGARIHNVEGECLRLEFPDKPPLFIRNELKAGGWYWNKFHRAWEPTSATRRTKPRAEQLAFAEKFVPKEMAA